MISPPFPLPRGLRLGLALALLAAVSLEAQSLNKVSFEDPSKPGLLRIRVGGGDLVIKAGTEAGVVVVESDAQATPAAPRQDGLRVLGDTETPYTLSVKGNTAELSSTRELWSAENLYTITVPATTSLQIESNWGGDIALSDVSGDLSIQGMNGDITLKRLSGAANIEIMNGQIDATWDKLNPDKPVSISSMNGTVVLRVPEDSKASVRFRTHNGAILTDFGEEVLKTKSEDLGGGDWGSKASRHVATATTIAREISRHIARQAQEISKEVNEAVREASEQQREIEEERREVAEHTHKYGNPDLAAPSAAPVGPEKPAPAAKGIPAAPKPPLPPLRPKIPALSGGKMVSGHLNRGGTSIQVTLMNGDITFRKASAGADKP